MIDILLVIAATTSAAYCLYIIFIRIPACYNPLDRLIDEDFESYLKFQGIYGLDVGGYFINRFWIWDINEHIRRVVRAEVSK